MLRTSSTRSGRPGSRIGALALAAILVALGGEALALGLGELQVSSALNERLVGRIDLRSAGDTELDDVRVSLASQAVFDEAGIVRSPAVTGLRFEITGSAGGPFIRVSSRDLLREPALEFVLEVTWRNGHLLKEYAVLLNAR